MLGYTVIKDGIAERYRFRSIFSDEVESDWLSADHYLSGLNWMVHLACSLSLSLNTSLGGLIPWEKSNSNS